jgi:putative transcription factor
MVESCVRCDINGDEVRLFDAIYEGRMTSICERCSIIENIPIIKKPDSSQLKDSEQGIGVYSRMKKLSGIKDEKTEETFFIEDKLKELNKNPQLEVPQKDKLNLVEHFHWDIMKNRRRKGFSQKQLAESLGESEIVIQMLEKAELPENAEQIIKKLEQFFQVKLKKISETEKFLQSHEEKEPILLDNKGRELEEIPEPLPQSHLDKEESEESEKSIDEFLENAETETKVKEPETEIEEFGEHEIRELNEERVDAEDEVERDLRGVDMEKGEFDITKANLGEVRISDLKELNRRKIEATKKEQIEEQKKIEERSSIIEARKEELRLMKEQESNELDRILGGTELLDVGKITKPIEDSDKVEEFDEELI